MKKAFLSAFFVLLLLFGIAEAYTAELKIETKYPDAGILIDILHPEELYSLDQVYTETDSEGLAYFDYKNDFYSSAGFRVSVISVFGDVEDEREFLGPYYFEEGEIVLSFLEPLIPEAPVPPADDSDSSQGSDKRNFYSASDDEAFIINSDSKPGEDAGLIDADFITAFVSKEVIGKPVFAAFVILVFMFLAWWLWSKKHGKKKA